VSRRVSSRVSSRARLVGDRAGDPLDGLVNLFDLGIVLAIAFLLVAVTGLEISQRTGREEGSDLIKLRPREQARPLNDPGERVAGRGERVGTVYRLRNGELIYVTGPRD
jgi:hypothetical protein